MNTPAKANLLGYNRQAMEAFFTSIGEPAYRAGQLTKWIHFYGLDNFQGMTNISKSLRRYLEEKTELLLPTLVKQQVSKDGTRKWLMKLGCGNAIETVYIPEAGRGTLCVSSQVGCALNCSFCATGKQGFNRDLSTAKS